MLLKRKLALAAMLTAFTLPAWADGFLSSALSAINETTPAGMVSQDSREDGVGGWFRDQGRGFSNIVKQGNKLRKLLVFLIQMHSVTNFTSTFYHPICVNDF